MMTRAQVEARAAQNRETWLKRSFRAWLLADNNIRPPYRWVDSIDPKISRTRFNALWEDAKDDWEAEMTKVPPSFENGSEGK